VLQPTGKYITISHAVEKQRKKYLKDYKRFNWGRIKHMLPKPQVRSEPKENKTKVEVDDKKNYHFMYICIKEIEPIVDSSDDEANKQ
tara:strand:+ start:486 stop:746 length:261 start_codon:yes stop_codon:yes gene_type:complete